MPVLVSSILDEFDLRLNEMGLIIHDFLILDEILPQLHSATEAWIMGMGHIEILFHVLPEVIPLIRSELSHFDLVEEMFRLSDSMYVDLSAACHRMGKMMSRLRPIAACGEVCIDQKSCRCFADGTSKEVNNGAKSVLSAVLLLIFLL